MNEHLDFRWMHGQRVAQVSETSGVYWRFVLSDCGSITVECLWRLISDRHIVVTSEDHGQQFGLPVPVDAVSSVTSLLADASIERVEIRDGTADLVIYFDRPFRLEAIPTSSSYESWQITARDGSSVVATGGGQLCFAPVVTESRTVNLIPIQ